MSLWLKKLHSIYGIMIRVFLALKMMIILEGGAFVRVLSDFISNKFLFSTLNYPCVILSVFNI